jgi:hypothetical protein
MVTLSGTTVAYVATTPAPGDATRGNLMSRSSKKKFRLGAVAALLTVSASACAIPVGNPLNIPLVQGCTLYILEPAQGTIKVPIQAGVIEIGCTLGL